MSRWDRLRSHGAQLPNRHAAEWEEALAEAERYQRARGCDTPTLQRLVHRFLNDRGWGYARALAWSKLVLTWSITLP